jgi:hypothetical protein
LKRRRYRLELEAVPPLVRPGDPAPPSPERTLARALKSLWRVYRLKCVSVEEVTAAGTPGTAGDPGTDGSPPCTTT